MIAFWNYCQRFVRRHKCEPHDDLASELLTRRQGDPDGLSDHEIAAVVFSLSLATVRFVKRGVGARRGMRRLEGFCVDAFGGRFWGAVPCGAR